MRYFIYFLLSLFPLPLHASELIHHDITVTLSPQEKRLSVADTITVPGDSPRDMQFTLHRGLTPHSPTHQVHIVKQRTQSENPFLDTYSIVFPRELHTVTITYEGTIYHPLVDSRMMPAQGIADSIGIISAEGVYLSGNTGWYPGFNTDFVTFDLEVMLPGPWDCVSQGERTRYEKGTRISTIHWRSPEPQESIYLIAGEFTSYYKSGNQFEAMVFLRSPDRTLADAYLEAAVRDIAMYSKLIGPYPYKKFALVENFWETGFGMPSFTLLGSTVIRLPFIINSSYPHEILHNWWGNGVYPVYEKGNWSEGLTAYLSDHLFKEQQGNGAEYRVATLQKYADYVSSGKDFPLTRFRSRNSQSSEAIGYGKSLMFFHMLRRELGDDLFRKGLRLFYSTYKFRYAGFDDIRTSFETASNRNLKSSFDQWITRTGAPRLMLGKAGVQAVGKEYLLTAVLEQTQEGAAYRLTIPVSVTLEDQDQAFMTTVNMDAKRIDIKLRLLRRPLRIDIDPEFDLFRRLGRDEIPPALSLALGSKKMLILLPSAANADLLKAYGEFAQAFARSGPDEVEVKLDSEVSALPHDRSITVLGWENRFIAFVVKPLSGYDVSVRDDVIRINNESLPHKDHSFAFITRHPENPDMALSLIAADLHDALRGLAVKLPHYGKYSYLAFKGPGPVNVGKGRWIVSGSSLTKFFPDAGGTIGKVKRGSLAVREPLVVTE